MSSLLAALVASADGELGDLAGTIPLTIFLAVAVWIGLRFFNGFLFICRPNEILVVSGKKHQLPSGEDSNFTVIQAGSHWQIPFIQNVYRMDVRIMPIELAVFKVLSNGGIPLDVHAIANVKITSDPRYVYNAVERFLNVPKQVIQQTAKQTLEGSLREVISQLTPEQVNEDRIEFANKLLENTSSVFNKLGLHLDTLKIQRVEDEAQYLVNIGRTQIANAVRDAENAESQANQEVAQTQAAATQTSEVAQKQAEITIVQKKNEMRTIVGQLEGEASSVENETEAAAQQARAEAEQELQTLRKELQAKRLMAEIVLPAEAQRIASELVAEGEAALRREMGVANAEAMKAMADALVAAGPHAREMFVLSQLDTFVGQVAAKVKDVQVGRIQIVDAGDGKALPALVASYPATVAAVLGTLQGVTGFSIQDLLAGDGKSLPQGGAR
jgi:flotillin